MPQKCNFIKPKFALFEFPIHLFFSKCLKSQFQVSLMLIFTFRIDQDVVDAPPGFMLPQFGLKCHGSESNPAKCYTRPINHQRVQIRQIVLENWFLRKKCQTWIALPDTESPPKYLFWENLENPDSLPKATCPSSPKLLRLGNLGTRGEGHLWAPPLARSKIGLY